MDRSTFEPAASDAAQVGRYDFYLNIHKALRLYMTDTLARFGRLDPADEQERAGALGQLRDLLEICDLHIEDENRFVHQALELRRPGSAERIADEHVSHGHAIATLRRDAAELEQCEAAERPRAALALYRRLALFVAENFEHMHYEETRLTPVLWAEYSDDELVAIEQAIVASIPPVLGMRLMHWFMPSLPHGERVAMLSGMREGAPPEAFQAAVAIARERLAAGDWQRLAGALGLPATQGTSSPGLRIAERW